MENSGVGLIDCCGGEDGSRLESPHGGADSSTPDHLNLSPASVDHHHVSLATTKIIERAGIKENTLLPNGKIKHRTDENGLINHVVLTSSTGSPDSTTSSLLGSSSINTSGVVAVNVEADNKYERCPSSPNASGSSSTKTVTNNNQSSSSIICNSGEDTHDKDDEVEVEEDGRGDDKPSLSSTSSVLIQSRTYQSHGDQVDCLSQQIDTLNISPSDSVSNIINNSTTTGNRGPSTEQDINNGVDVRADDSSAGVPSSSSCTHHQSTRADDPTDTVAVNNDNNNNGEGELEYRVYECELQMADIMRLITRDLSEPYSIYTYRYFIHNWPKLCFLCMDGSKCVGAIVCKLDIHKRVIRRGYIAMLAVDAEYRRRKIGSNLVLKAIRAMLADGCDEVVLETEITNKAALKLYENLGFVRDKRLFRYYLNGVDALRLKLWLR